VYLEAMATAKPAIGCRGQGIEEIVHHGVNSCLVSPDNLDELLATLDHLLNDASVQTRIGAAARQTILQRFTLAHQADGLNRIYRECLS
jgi:glycosyltransferase involved in cell wall biosynthesis